MNRKYALLILCVLSALTIVRTVYAISEPDNESVNLLDIPKHLAKALGISEYAGKLLASLCLITIFMLPTMIWSRNIYVMLFIGLTCLGFCVAIGWLDFWFMLVICLIVAGLWSGKMRGWLT